MIFSTPSLNIESIPDDLLEDVELPVNGGNVISVDRDSDLGQFLVKNGFEFSKRWSWLVIYR